MPGTRLYGLKKFSVFFPAFVSAKEGDATKRPTQPPINPPYKQFMDMRRGVAGSLPAPPQGTPLSEHPADLATA